METGGLEVRVEFYLLKKKLYSFQTQVNKFGRSARIRQNT
jgi:hypothetical protein